MSEYELTVTVRLPEQMDHGPLEVLTSIVLGALSSADIEVRAVRASVVNETKG